LKLDLGCVEITEYLTLEFQCYSRACEVQSYAVAVGVGLLRNGGPTSILDLPTCPSDSISFLAALCCILYL
jgi:hypothetical protein